jgi:hypothetical protein
MTEKNCKRTFVPALLVALEQPVNDAARQTIYEGNARQFLHHASARGILASLRLIAYTALLGETLQISALVKWAGLCMTGVALPCRKKR